MTWSATLSEMLTELRARGGYRRSTALTDAILTPFLNSGIAEVHELIARHQPDFLVTSADLATVANVATVALPTDFYKLRRLDLIDGANVCRLRSFQIDEETYIAESTVWDLASGSQVPRYMLQAGNLRLVPIPTAAQTLRAWYIPHATRLVLGQEQTASLALSSVTDNCTTVVEAVDDGDFGNDITLAFVADGTGAGGLTETAYPALVFHYQSGVTTVAQFETALQSATHLTVKTGGQTASILTAPADTFAATHLAGGVDESSYDGVNGHEDLVYEHALRLCKARDRGDTSVHDQAIVRIEKRLLYALEGRDQGEPEYLADYGKSQRRWL